MSKSFSFFVESEEIQKSLDFEQLNRLPKEIRDKLFQKEKYHVKSSVNLQNFHSFFDYFLNEKDMPDINVDNIYEFRQLSEEFNCMIDYLSSDEFDNLNKISVLLNVSKNEKIDKSTFENYISQNLDFYLDNYQQEMHKIPISALYNIFDNKNRKLNNHEKAYQFILSGNQDLFVLIKTLDSTKLSESTLKEAISNQDAHLGFIPQNSFHFYDSIKKEVSSSNDSFRRTIDELNRNYLQEHEQYKQTFEDLNKKIGSLIDENNYLRNQLKNDERDINMRLIDKLNGLSLKLQRNKISKIIENSTNVKMIDFFYNVTNFFHYLYQFLIPLEEKLFEFQIQNSKKDEDQYVICILNKATKIIYDNKLFQNEEFQNQIQAFEKVCFEIKYPDDSYDLIYNDINSMKKSLKNDELIIIGVFIIGNVESDAFPDRKYTSYIKLDSSFKIIKESSFRDCLSLEKITIPSSVKFIGERAFESCHSLKNISIPYLVKKISKSMFYDCFSIRIILIPPSVNEIESMAFYGCLSLKHIMIPSSVTLIGEKVFYGCRSLTQISIPPSVTSIGNYSFKDCSSLEKVTMGMNITKIGEYFFADCIKLKEFIIPSSATIIEKFAFYNCRSLKQIIIPSSITSIGNEAFYGCELLEKISIPLSVIEIGISAFENCSSLVEMLIPPTVTILEERILAGCTKLEKFTIQSLVVSIKENAFKECTSLTQINIPSSVTSIEYGAFDKCKSLKQISIPSSVTALGINVFSECVSLMQVSLPSSIHNISGTFECCSSLTEISIPSSVTSIGRCTFKGCTSLAEITIPSSVTSIGSSAFEECTSLAEISIPSSVTIIESSAFEGCTSLTKISVSSGITEINDGTFKGCSSLKQINIPSSVNKIKSFAFSGCTSLEEVTIPSSVNKIGNGAFSGCTSLTHITIPSSVTELKEGTFKECSSLKQIVLPSSITSIGQFSFYKCSSLTQIKIPSSVTFIGPCAFHECSSLTQIKIPSSVELIESNAFYGCSSIQKAIIPSQTYQIPPILDFNDFSNHKKMGTNIVNTFKANLTKTGEEVVFNIYNSYHFDNMKKFLSFVKKADINIPGFIKIKNLCLPLEDARLDNHLRDFEGYSIVTEYMKNGSIDSIIKKYLDSKGANFDEMNPTIRSKIIFGVACFMKHLHKNNICHQNILHHNIFLDENLEPVIGLIFHFYEDDSETRSIGENDFIHILPELEDFNDVSLPGDVFLYANFLYRMFSSKFLEKKEYSLYKYYMKISGGWRPCRPDQMPDCYWELIKKCWENDPDKRPSFNEITEMLKDDKYAIDEFGMTTDLDQLHEYQQRIDVDD